MIRVALETITATVTGKLEKENAKISLVECQ